MRSSASADYFTSALASGFLIAALGLYFALGIGKFAVPW